MPLRELIPSYSNEHQALVRALSAEWSNPRAEVAEPVINIERDGQGSATHVYVVWSQWALVERIERSEIIMEAANVVLPVDEVANITIAMGLTPEEAPLMGIEL